MPKKYDDKFRAIIKREYCLHDKNIEQLHDEYGVNKQTLRKWRDQEDWDEINKIRNASLFRVEQHAVAQIRMIFEEAEKQKRTLTAAEVDMTVKLRKLIDSLDKNMAFVTNAVDAIGQFMEFIRERDHELYEQITQLSIEFSQHLVNSTKTN